jgi:hypothetical protein
VVTPTSSSARALSDRFVIVRSQRFGVLPIVFVICARMRSPVISKPLSKRSKKSWFAPTNPVGWRYAVTRQTRSNSITGRARPTCSSTACTRVPRSSSVASWPDRDVSTSRSSYGEDRWVDVRARFTPSTSFTPRTIGAPSWSRTSINQQPLRPFRCCSSGSRGSPDRHRAGRRARNSGSAVALVERNLGRHQNCPGRAGTAPDSRRGHALLVHVHEDQRRAVCAMSACTGPR